MRERGTHTQRREPEGNNSDKREKTKVVGEGGGGGGLHICVEAAYASIKETALGKKKRKMLKRGKAEIQRGITRESLLSNIHHATASYEKKKSEEMSRNKLAKVSHFFSFSDKQ